MKEQRTCIVCRKKSHKKELIRLYYDSKIKVDLIKNNNGRGYYVCNFECFKKLKTKKGLNKVFKQNIDKEILEEIEKNLEINLV